MRQFSRDLHRACRIRRCEEKKEIVNGCFKFHISIVLLKDVEKVRWMRELFLQRAR